MDYLTGYGAFHWVQMWSHPALDAFFRAVTDLGYPLTYYLVIGPLFWVAERRRTTILFVLLLVAGLVNDEAKSIFNTARPDPSLTHVLDLRPLQAGSPSFPSGHAQIAVVFWGYLALWVRQRWFTIAAVILITLISFSRIYLAAHFPIDVVGGLVLGAALFAFVPVIERWAASGFPMTPAARLMGIVAAAVFIYVSTDPAEIVIYGCFLALLLLLSLPAPTIGFTNRVQIVAVVVAGLALQVVSAWLLGQLSGQPADAASGFKVATLWLIALWAYPRLVSTVLPQPEPQLARD